MKKNIVSINLLNLFVIIRNTNYFYLYLQKKLERGERVEFEEDSDEESQELSEGREREEEERRWEGEGEERRWEGEGRQEEEEGSEGEELMEVFPSTSS